MSFVEWDYRPSIVMTITENCGAAYQMSLLLSQVKATGGEGVEISWLANLTSMLGTSAKEAWGDWECEPPLIEDGSRIPGMLPGKHPFIVNDFVFSVEI